MFKIVKYPNNSGKILMKIETDYQIAADFCRFFGAVNKFLDFYNYRVQSAKSFDLYQKTAPHKMALHKKKIAEQLERFRAMPGTRIERMRILKEIRVSNGKPEHLTGLMPCPIIPPMRMPLEYTLLDVFSALRVTDTGKSKSYFSYLYK